jgi:phenylpropionate dioxygenase-like ring-hydroxylating dioxygenase large terminal subunit
MIRNQWYSVLESSEVGSRPVGVTRMGEKLVFWRSETGISCLRDQCVHRGAALSAGKIVDGEVQCPFHGLRYDSTGRVTLIPANGKSAKVPDYFKVNAYPARDEHGFIWLWWGEAKETYPKIPWFEDIDANFTSSTVRQHWATHYSRAIENQLDVAHLPFVHYNTIGRGNKTLVNGPYTTFEDETITVYPKNEVDDGQTPLKPEEIKAPPYDFYVQLKFPNIWQNHIGKDYRIVVSFTPIDDENTLMYLRTYQKSVSIPVLSSIAGFFSGRGSSLIANQDRRVVITQIPKRPVLGGGERLFPGDRPIAVYRMERQRLIDEAVKAG